MVLIKNVIISCLVLTEEHDSCMNSSEIDYIKIAQECLKWKKFIFILCQKMILRAFIAHDFMNIDE